MRARTAKAMKTSKATSTRSVGTNSRGQRLRYSFDNSMSRGTPALVAWLAVLTLGLILLFTLILLITSWSPDDEGGGKPGPIRQMFISLMHALDPGTVAGDTGSWRYLTTMLLLTVAGLFIVSALIGVIATGIDAKLVDLRRGRSLVIEKEHTVILGWSDSVYTIIRELSVANESRKKPVVVVMSERDKVEMEDDLRDKVGDTKGTKVVCRTGSPMDIGDLALTSHNTARSVIVLSPGGDDPDSEVIKTLLALKHTQGGHAHAVAEISDPRNLDAARLVGGDRAVVLNKEETIARLIVQTSRQSGAAAVYTELFDFEGDEIYFHSDARLDGKTYREALLTFAEATLIGVVDDDGTVQLNPPADTDVTGRELVVIASDDSALNGAALSSTVVDEGAITDAVFTPSHSTRALVIGWNSRAAAVVRELDAYAEPGSELVVVSEYGEAALPPLTNLMATIQRGATSDRAILDLLDLPSFNQVIVLAYSDHLPVQKADARTLVTLLHVREILDHDPDNATAVVSEMIDDRNRALAQVAQVDDVIVSDEIVSLMLTQLSEEARLEVVFEDLLDEEGSEIYLRPATAYVQAGAEVSFSTIVEAASRRGETALGYRVAAHAHDQDKGYGVRVNPAKSEMFVATAADRVVVLAED